MIDYPMYCRIHHLQRSSGLNAAQIARITHLHPDTVAYWLKTESAKGQANRTVMGGGSSAKGQANRDSRDRRTE